MNVNIPAKLANAIVKLEFTENFKNYFANGAQMKITSGNGNEWSIDYENTPYIFVESGKTVTISGQATKQRPSATVEPAVVVFDAVEKSLAPCTIYTYKYDVSTAGSVSVTFSLNNEPSEEIIVSEGEELNDDAIM